jgi:hypothetical protein
MFGDSRAFWFPREVDSPKSYEDAFCYDAGRGIAAVADGVSQGMLSKPWANILTKAAVEDPPNPEEAEEFQCWLAERRSEWSSGVDFDNLGFFHRRRLQQVGGGFATFLWLELFPVTQDDPCAEEDTYRWIAHAVGDCCMFHVRDGELLTTFPMMTSTDFGRSPQSLGSADLSQDHLLTFERYDDYCRVGDLFVLCSDAIAHALIRARESDRPVEWDWLLSLDDPAWQTWVTTLRAEKGLEFDDTTLVLLPVADSNPQDQILVESPGSIAWSGELFVETPASGEDVGTENDSPADNVDTTSEQVEEDQAVSHASTEPTSANTAGLQSNELPDVVENLDEGSPAEATETACQEAIDHASRGDEPNLETPAEAEDMGHASRTGEEATPEMGAAALEGVKTDEVETAVPRNDTQPNKASHQE